MMGGGGGGAHFAHPRIMLVSPYAMSACAVRKRNESHQKIIPARVSSNQYLTTLAADRGKKLLTQPAMKR